MIMVDYREILRLQSLGHNITRIAAQLPQHRKISRTAYGRERDSVATWRGGNKSTALCSALSGTAGKSKSLSGTRLC